MSDSKSLDHWRRLAQLLGAPMPVEPAPAPPEPEPAVVSETPLLLEAAVLAEPPPALPELPPAAFAMPEPAAVDIVAVAAIEPPAPSSWPRNRWQK